MKARIIDLPTKYVKRVLSQRCQHKSTTTGTAPFGGSRNRCARVAVVEIDGIKFCRQHAGYIALDALIKETE